MTILAALLLAAAPASTCAASPPLDEPWTSWTQSGDAIAGTQAFGAPSLILGKPVAASLTPADHVQFAAPPAKGAKEGYGGLFTVALKRPARIGIALSGAAWVDAVDGTQALTSVDHGHGPDCSGIRKIVWFDLSAGRHVIQIAGSKTRDIRIMAADGKANQPNY